MSQRIFITLLFSALIFFSTQCTEKTNPNFQQTAADPEFLHQSLERLSSVLKHDIFPPMILARIYTYAHIASYEAMVPSDAHYQSLAGQLHGLPTMPKPTAGKEYCYPLAAIRAYLKVSQRLAFSEDSVKVFADEIMKKFHTLGIPREVFERSIAFGDTIGGAVVEWSKKDNYAQTRSATKYSVTPKNPVRWRPTAPDYADAAEPHWREIRALMLDSAAQFKPVAPAKFDTLQRSVFYKNAAEVRQMVKDSTADRIATAWYWDDNPIATQNAGHMNFARKKISPGGHWLHITMYACRQSKKNFMESADAYVRVAVGLFDAFISCWDEKYRSEVLRPESYITKYIDREWTPIIVTPPFPEYTSGHSVISGTSSRTLTAIFGQNFRFTDSTEQQFGHGVRSFNSFDEAAQQAAMSRMYAGIHYRPAVEIGLAQGQKIGDYMNSKLKTFQK